MSGFQKTPRRVKNFANNQPPISRNPEYARQKMPSIRAWLSTRPRPGLGGEARPIALPQEEQKVSRPVNCVPQRSQNIASLRL